MKKILQSPKRIKFSDCDPLGHLYNAKYIQYLLDAREDQAEAAYNFHPITHMRNTGKGWAVVQNQIAYLQAVFYNETVICQSFIRSYNTRMMDIECTMWDDQYRYLKSILWTRFIYMDKSHKAAYHPDDLMDMFKNLVNPIEEESFDERVMAFRNHNKVLRGQSIQES